MAVWSDAMSSTPQSFVFLSRAPRKRVNRIGRSRIVLSRSRCTMGTRELMGDCEDLLHKSCSLPATPLPRRIMDADSAERLLR